MTGWRRDRRGWWEQREGARYAIARRVPVRWDLKAGSLMPEMGRRRLAHAVRQDMWRLLQDLRGFQPAVEVSRRADGLAVTAGGTVNGPVPPRARAALHAMLNDPAYRAAWARAAGHRA